MRRGAMAGWWHVILTLVCFVATVTACGPISIGPAETEVPSIAAEARPTLAEAPTTVAETATPVVEPTATTAPAAADASAGQCTVNALRGLRLRAGPGTDYRFIALLPNGEVTNVISRNADSTWIAVRTNAGQEGWLSAQFLNCTAPPDTFPEAPPAPPPPG